MICSPSQLSWPLCHHSNGPSLPSPNLSSFFEFFFTFLLLSRFPSCRWISVDILLYIFILSIFYFLCFFFNRCCIRCCFHLWPVYYSAAVLEYWYCELVSGFDSVYRGEICFHDPPHSAQVFFGNCFVHLFVTYLVAFLLWGTCMMLCLPSVLLYRGSPTYEHLDLWTNPHQVFLLLFIIIIVIFNVRYMNVQDQCLEIEPRSGSVSGNWATCPYSHSWCLTTIQVTNLIWVSLSNCSLDTKSDQW